MSDCETELVSLLLNRQQKLFLAHLEHKVLRVSYCDRPLFVVIRRASFGVRKLFYLNIFSSETTHWILTSQECSLGGPLSKLFKLF